MPKLQQPMMSHASTPFVLTISIFNSNVSIDNRKLPLSLIELCVCVLFCSFMKNWESCLTFLLIWGYWFAYILIVSATVKEKSWKKNFWKINSIRIGINCNNHNSNHPNRIEKKKTSESIMVNLHHGFMIADVELWKDSANDQKNKGSGQLSAHVHVNIINPLTHSIKSIRKRGLYKTKPKESWTNAKNSMWECVCVCVSLCRLR